MITDKDCKKKIGERLKAGSGTKTRVITRWKLAFKPKDWGAALSSVEQDGVVDGWYLTRIARRSKKVGANKWNYEWEYVLWYFRSLRDNGSNDNSEDDLNAMLERVAEEFEANPELGFTATVTDPDGGTMGVDRHGEIQVLNMDTLDNTIHVAQCRLTVYLTKVKVYTQE